MLHRAEVLRPALDDAYVSGQVACLLMMGKLWSLGVEPGGVVLCSGMDDSIELALMEQMIEGAQAVCADAQVSCERGEQFPSPTPQLAISVAAAGAPAPIAVEAGAGLYLLGQLGAGALVAAGQRDAARRVALRNAGAGRLGPQLARSGVALAAAWSDGLIGQLVALCRAADVDAQVWTSRLPTVAGLDALTARGVRPRGVSEVWERFSGQVRLGHEAWRDALCDPLPSGLLVAAPLDAQPELERRWGEPVAQIGQLSARFGGGARVVIVPG